MKTIIVTLTLLFSSFFIEAQTDGATITVTVPVNSTEGKVIFGLYTKDNFMKEPSVGLESSIVNGKAIATFKNVTPGEYAIILYHDKNGNQQMDFEPSGMPKEMYGVSNNIMSMGPPMWNDAKFEVSDKAIDMEIRM